MDFKAGDEVLVREFRTKVKSTNLYTKEVWVCIPGRRVDSVSLPLELLEKVDPEIQVGDVWRGEDGNEWYVRKCWTGSSDDITVERFTSAGTAYASYIGGVTTRPLSRFFEEQNPVLVYRRDTSG